MDLVICDRFCFHFGVRINCLPMISVDLHQNRGKPTTRLREALLVDFNETSNRIIHGILTKVCPIYARNDNANSSDTRMKKSR